MKTLLIVSIIFVLIIGISITSISAQKYEIPSWVKGVAEFWAEDKITDEEFGDALEFLIDSNIIKVSNNEVDREFFEEYKTWAHNEIDKFQRHGDLLQDTIKELKNEVKALKNKYRLLLDQYNTQSSKLDIVRSNKDLTSDQLTLYVEAVEKYQDEVDTYFEQEKLKPKTTIIDQKINWNVSDSKGNLYNWSMPIESYESVIRKIEPIKFLKLNNPSTGDVYTVRDHTLFVRTSFTNIIDQVYDNSKNGYDFAYEVWYIVSQLTTYSYDIGEDPRWALETLSRGGGDCEDTAILIAEMLKSSKHTENWKISLVYFDAYNPKNPKTMNHIAVHIEDGKNNYYIESTAKDDPYAWKDGIMGWHYEV